jgi:hypothetical protein
VCLLEHPGPAITGCDFVAHRRSLGERAAAQQVVDVVLAFQQTVKSASLLVFLNGRQQWGAGFDEDVFC